MPTTTNNGWTIPADTDLVKDGAAAIRTLGQAIDTTLGVYTPGSGLTKINTTSFSAVSSVSLPTNTFTSTYKNYRLLLNLSGTPTAGATITFRLRAAGTDNSSGLYNQMTLGLTENNAGSNRAQSGATSFTLETVSVNAFFDMSLDILSPQVATYTKAAGNLVCDNNTAFIGKYIGFIHQSSTAFDSMTFSTSSGTFSGTITVLGYSA